MRIGITCFVLFACLTLAQAQSKCLDINVGGFFEQLKQLKPIDPSSLSYRDYDKFDFATFEPVGNVKSSSFISVGQDSQGNIREIIFTDVIRYSLLVYDLGNYRIFLVKREDNSGKFLYTPAAIFSSKDCDESYMINVKAQFKDNASSYDLSNHFPIGDYRDISCLMKLDRSLYPKEMLKFLNLKVVLYSGFRYVAGSKTKLDVEVLHIFINSEKKIAGFEISEKTYLSEIADKANELKAKSDLIVFSKPSVFDDTEAPIWIFSGAHQYFPSGR